MAYNSVSSKWEPRSNLLDTLTNVDTTGKITGDTIQWNGGSNKWEKVSPSSVIPLSSIDVNSTVASVVITVSTGSGAGYSSVSNRLPLFGNGIPVGL